MNGCAGQREGNKPDGHRELMKNFLYIIILEKQQVITFENVMAGADKFCTLYLSIHCASTQFYILGNAIMFCVTLWFIKTIKYIKDRSEKLYRSIFFKISWHTIIHGEDESICI